MARDAIEPIWDDIPFNKDNALETFLDGLTIGQRGLIAVEWCQKEICDGGMRRMFSNAAGRMIPWAIEGFRLIGAEKYAENLSRASSILGTDHPKSRSARRRVFGALDKSLKDEISRLESEFYELLDSTEDDLESFRGRYVKKNPDQFVME